MQNMDLFYIFQNSLYFVSTPSQQQPSCKKELKLKSLYFSITMFTLLFSQASQFMLYLANYFSFC